jgi:hypothetical protein
MVIIDAICSPATRELTAGARLGLRNQSRTGPGARPSMSEPGLAKTPAAPHSLRVVPLSSLDPNAGKGRRQVGDSDGVFNCNSRASAQARTRH